MRFRVIDAMQSTPHRQHLCPLRHQTWRAFFRVVVSSGIRDDQLRPLRDEVVFLPRSDPHALEDNTDMAAKPLVVFGAG